MPFIKNAIPSWTKTTGRKVVFNYRHATSRCRSLPNFIIIGAQKSGTSSLYHYLSQHPQLIPSIRKEVHYFDGGVDRTVDNYEKGESWYRAHFPCQPRIHASLKTFEASPLYMFHPLAPERISALMPQVKSIALLRNPTERAVSHYFHVKRQGNEALPIREAIENEETRLAPVLARQDYKDDRFRHFSYKARGLYRAQLKRFLKFFPREQLLVISSETFFREPRFVLERIFEFVGVGTDFRLSDLRAKNVASSKSDVDPEVYEQLNEFFRPHNQALYDLLGEDYGW
jgi:hypothetical protein